MGNESETINRWVKVSIPSAVKVHRGVVAEVNYYDTC